MSKAGDQAGNMSIDAIATLGGTYRHVIIAVATVREWPFIHDSPKQNFMYCMKLIRERDIMALPQLLTMFHMIL